MSKPPLRLGRPARILVTVLEEPIRAFIAESLRCEGHDVVATASADEALRVVRESPEGLIIMTYERDPLWPGHEGLAAFTTARRPPDGHVVILLAADPAVLEHRDAFHADEIVLMPFDMGQLCHMIRRTQRLFRTRTRGGQLS